MPAEDGEGNPPAEGTIETLALAYAQALVAEIIANEAYRDAFDQPHEVAMFDVFDQAERRRSAAHTRLIQAAADVAQGE